MRAVRHIVVSTDLCKACGICIELCPRNVFDVDGDGQPVVARLELCTVCLFCEWHCPDFALRVEHSASSHEVSVPAPVSQEA